MPTIHQSPLHPEQILFALKDLAQDGLERVRVAVAYATRAGCESLVSALEEKIGPSAMALSPKLLVTSFDFGHTEPEALKYWRSLPNSEVKIANVHRPRGTLDLSAGASNFHPKAYLFDYSSIASILVGSPNLTRRALTVNTEVAITETNLGNEASERLWIESWHSGESLSDDLLEEYALARPHRPVPNMDPPIQGPPVLPSKTVIRLIDAIDSGLDPSRYRSMWIQAGTMTSGGSHNQLELPRGTNLFFGFNYDTYGPEHITIGQPILMAKGRVWSDRQLSWHAGGGQNAMERLNLPTQAQGGYQYADTAILFRRTSTGFELTVAPWGSSRANAWLNASAGSGTLFRTGLGDTSRLCGLLN